MVFKKCIRLWVASLGCFMGLLALEKNCYQSICSVEVPRHMAVANEAVIRAWTVLDVLRSVTIAPKDRIRFAQKIMDDILVVVTELAALVESTRYCTEFLATCSEDIAYLDEVVSCLIDSFCAVFYPLCSEEEELLNAVFLKMAELMDQFRRESAKTSLKDQSQKESF